MNGYIDKLAFTYIKDRKILVTLSKGKDAWYIPGGKREAGESDHQALIREVKEELSVNLKENTIKYYGTFKAQAHGKPEGTIVKMTCFTGDFEGELKPAGEIEKIDFFNSMTKEPLSPVDHVIFTDLKTKNIID